MKLDYVMYLYDSYYIGVLRCFGDWKLDASQFKNGLKKLFSWCNFEASLSIDLYLWWMSFDANSYIAKVQINYISTFSKEVSFFFRLDQVFLLKWMNGMKVIEKILSIEYM